MQKNLIIAFAHNARGFYLSKWLFSQGIIECYCNPPNDLSPKLNSTNHDMVPFYNDIIFNWRTSEEKELFDKLHHKLSTIGTASNEIIDLLDQSKNKPIQSYENKYNLILTHLSSYISLKKLSDTLSARVIRITFNDTKQAAETYYRIVNPNSPPEAFDYARDVYYKFIVNYDFCINVKLDDVLDLNLDFLIEELV